MSWNNSQYGSNHNVGTGVYDFLNPMLDALAVGISEGFRRLNARYDAGHDAYAIYSQAWHELELLKEKKNEIIRYTNKMQGHLNEQRRKALKKEMAYDHQIWSLERQVSMQKIKIEHLENELKKLKENNGG